VVDHWRVTKRVPQLKNESSFIGEGAKPGKVAGAPEIRRARNKRAPESGALDQMS